MAEASPAAAARPPLPAVAARMALAQALSPSETTARLRQRLQLRDAMVAPEPLVQLTATNHLLHSLYAQAQRDRMALQAQLESCEREAKQLRERAASSASAAASAQATAQALASADVMAENARLKAENAEIHRTHGRNTQRLLEMVDIQNAQKAETAQLKSVIAGLEDRVKAEQARNDEARRRLQDDAHRIHEKENHIVILGDELAAHRLELVQREAQLKEAKAENLALGVRLADAEVELRDIMERWRDLQQQQQQQQLHQHQHQQQQQQSMPMGPYGPTYAGGILPVPGTPISGHMTPSQTPAMTSASAGSVPSTSTVTAMRPPLVTSQTASFQTAIGVSTPTVTTPGPLPLAASGSQTNLAAGAASSAPSSTTGIAQGATAAASATAASSSSSTPSSTSAAGMSSTTTPVTTGGVGRQRSYASMRTLISSIYKTSSAAFMGAGTASQTSQQVAEEGEEAAGNASPPTAATAPTLSPCQLPARGVVRRVTLPSTQSSPSCLAISSDGSMLAVAGSERLISLYETRSLTAKAHLAGAMNAVLDLDFSPSGALLLGACFDHAIKLWHVPTSRLRVSLAGHIGKVTCASFAGEGTIMSGSYDRTLKVWDVVRGVCSKTIFTLSSCNGLGLIGGTGGGTDATTLASGHVDGHLRVWDTRFAQHLVREMAGLHAYPITGIDVAHGPPSHPATTHGTVERGAGGPSGDHYVLTSCRAERRACLVDLRMYRTVATLTTPDAVAQVEERTRGGGVTRYTLSPDGRYGLGAGFVWDLAALGSGGGGGGGASLSETADTGRMLDDVHAFGTAPDMAPVIAAQWSPLGGSAVYTVDAQRGLALWQ